MEDPPQRCFAEGAKHVFSHSAQIHSMMYNRMLKEYFLHLTRCLCDGTLPGFPHSDSDPTHPSQQELHLKWDFDPHVKDEGVRHVDFVAAHFLDHKDLVSDDQWNEIVNDGTRSNFSSALSRKHLDDYIDSGEPAWFSPPDGLDEQTSIILVTLQGKLAETYNQGNIHNRIDL